MAEVGFAASILGIIQITTKVASLSYSYIGGVKRAPGEVRKLSDELKSLTTVLTTLNICAKDHGPVLQQLQGPLQTCISDLRRIQTKLESSAKAKGSSWWDMGFTRFQWPFEEEETLNFISQIERFKSLVLVTMSIDQATRSKVIETGIQDMKAVKSKDEELRIERKRMDVLNWLYPDAFDKRHIEISGRRQKNTGQWILREPEVQEWCGGNPRNRLLWGYGIPGAGKTFLSSFLIDYLQERATKANHGLAYIYFNYKEQDRQDPRSFLASLVKQLACQLEKLPKKIEELHERLEKKHGRPTIDDLSTILFELKKSFTLTFIVCDALDECDPEKQRKSLLPLFHKIAKNDINVLLTSREYPEDIQVSLQGSASVKIRLWAKDEDITFYIKQKIADNPRAKRLVDQGSCEDRIISQLQRCANGMFLLVHFHIKHLCQQTTVKQILEELYKLENSSRDDYPMDPTYNKVLDALRAQPKGCTELAFKVLTWLVRARRVLTVRELQLAVSVPVGENCTTFDNSDLPDRSTLLDVCASLVMVDEKEDTIRLVHYTAQEYLLRNAIISNDTDSNVMITIACITFLSLDIFFQGACTSRMSLQDRWELYPFLDYAAKQLTPHLEKCDEELSARPILIFLNRKGNISSYLQALHAERWSKRSYDYDFYPKGQGALHVAAALGHRSVTQILLESGADVMVADNLGRTPLHWAASGGYKQAPKFLIGEGVDASATDNALHLAARDGYEPVARLLLEKGAGISSADKYGNNALHFATRYGHEPVVRLLLEKGADISSADNDGNNALYYAVIVGREPLARLLLEKGADISFADKYGKNALHHAARYGHEPVVRLLLEKGADISSADNNGKNALHHAARYGHEPVVRLLLEKGADISSADNDGQNALHFAARGGREPVVRLLLEKGADISSADNDGQNALHHAARGGREPVVRLLLEKGADISSADNDGRNALHFAERWGYNRIIQLLRGQAASITTT